jgi:hypothetical protein
MPNRESNDGSNRAKDDQPTDAMIAEIAKSLDDLGANFALLRSAMTGLTQHAAETQAARLQIDVELAARNEGTSEAELAGLRERAADASAFARAVDAGFPTTAPGAPPLGSDAEAIEMIDFTNNGYAEAVRLLREIGHRGELEIKTVDGRPPGGRVVEQAPRPHTRLAADARIVLTFAVAREATVPELVGRTRNEATQFLASLGLQPKFSGPSRASIVSKQKPEAGTRLARDGEVELVMTGKDR